MMYHQGLKSEKIFSSELSVHLRAPMIKARATVYHTEFKDQNQILTFYHDDYRTLVNHIMYGINTTHQGIEFGGEAHMFYDLWLQAALNLGNYSYTNRPEATIAFDNGSRADTTELIYLKNFFITGTPQTAGALGLKWVGPDFLFVNLSAQLF
jgi:outer membrane receptor for ferrienterochelin and colicin